MISIIIPIYNTQQYLSECLESIIHQTYLDFEVILVNDGSKDNSKEICLDFCKKDSRFRLIEQTNSGVSAARNNGIKNSHGKYIAFVDSDDVIASDYLKVLYNAIKDCDMSNCDLSFNKMKLNTGDICIRKYSPQEVVNAYQSLSMRNLGITCSLFKKDIIDRIGLQFVVGCYVNEDTEFVLKYVANCETIAVSSYIGYFYREVGTSAMHKLTKKSLTSIDASRRIEEYLWNKSLIKRPNCFIEAGIMNYIFKSAILSDREIYEYLHSEYNIKQISKTMFKHPKFRRRAVSKCYYYLGKRLFWLFGGAGKVFYSIYLNKYQ